MITDIYGESGSGKTTMGRSLLGLLPRTAQVTARTMSYEGTDLLSCTERDWQKLRGRRMSMVMQDPKYSLNPVKTVGRQIGETLRLHRRIGRSETRRLEDDRVVFETPEYGVAPGQAAVLYAGDRVLGGGWIAETERAELMGV